MTDAATKLDRAIARSERADHNLRVYTAVLVTITAVLILVGYGIDFVSRTATRDQIVDCVTPDTECSNQIQDANQDATSEQVQRLIDSIVANSDQESRKIRANQREIQDKLDHVLELLR